MTVECPSCGSFNEGWASFCTNCGAVLPKTVGAPTAPAVPAVTLSSKDLRGLSPQDVLGRKRTETGLLLLVIGFVLSAVPFVNIIAIFILIPAVILTLLGAHAYGTRHRRFVMWSLVLYLVILVALIAVVANLVFQIILAGAFGGTTPDLIDAAWRWFVIGTGITSASLALPYFLITFKLQGVTGRQMLWVAVTVQVVVSGLQAWYLLPLSAAFIGEMPGGLAVFGTLTGDPVSFLFALSALPWAYAYYLAYRRVAAPPYAASSPAR